MIKHAKKNLSTTRVYKTAEVVGYNKARFTYPRWQRGVESYLPHQKCRNNKNIHT